MVQIFIDTFTYIDNTRLLSAYRQPSYRVAIHFPVSMLGLQSERITGFKCLMASKFANNIIKRRKIYKKF